MKRHRLVSNLENSPYRYDVFEGRSHLVVPVIMARSNVVMNGGVVPVEELVPHAWNGVPVTVSHPTNGSGESIPANTPRTLEQYQVGRIFNARVVNGDLKAEAWIDVEKCNEVYPGLVTRLAAGEAVDVSTGYFCDSVPKQGELNGRVYNEIHRNLRPEHLALLPEIEGACSFEDGCGVRANRRKPMKLNDALKALTQAVAVIQNSVAPKTKKKVNERSDSDNPTQMVADLISQDASPFTAEDAAALGSMSIDTLKKMRDQYCKPAATDNAEGDAPPADTPHDEPDGDEPTDNADDNQEPDGDEEKTMKKNQRRTHCSQTETLVNAVRQLTVTVNQLSKNGGLSDEDRAALAEVKANRKSKRDELVAHVVANSRIPKASVEAMDFATLESVANGLLPAPTFGARPMPVANNAAKDAAVEAMTPPDVVSIINARNKRSA